jgi:hypothetical protein
MDRAVNPHRDTKRRLEMYKRELDLTDSAHRLRLADKAAEFGVRSS